MAEMVGGDDDDDDEDDIHTYIHTYIYIYIYMPPGIIASIEGVLSEIF